MHKKWSNVQVGVVLSLQTLCLMHHLWLFHGCIVLVTHGTDLHASLPLSVSLAEELLHDAVCPLAVQLERLRGVAQVCTVHHILKDLVKETNALFSTCFFLPFFFFLTRNSQWMNVTLKNTCSLTFLPNSSTMMYLCMAHTCINSPQWYPFHRTKIS